MYPAHIATVERRGDRPVLILDGAPLAPLIHALTDCPGARWSWEEVPARNIALFARAGIRLFQVDVWFEQMIGADDRLDITLARRQIAGVLAQCPEAAVMLRLHVNAPPWWCERHRDECVGYADCEPDEPEVWGLIRPLKEDNVQPLRASFSSRRWRAWAAAHLEGFCRELAQTPEGDALFGLQLANGVYGEWHQFAFMYHDPDTGPAATHAFRGWLQERYGSESACARAWHRAVVRWDEIHPPDSAARETAAIGILRDPRRQQDVIDYFTFLHDEMVDALLGVAEKVKAAWPRPLVTAAFQGYFYNQFNRHAAGAHLGFARALASPHLDCFCAPQSYEAAAREMGGSGSARGIVGAVARAGKLWLDEMDQATSVSGSPWEKSFQSTLDGDVALMRRNVLHPVTRGGGMWWYEFGPLAGTPDFAGRGLVGWWDHPRLQQEVKALREIVAARVDRPLARYADVLVVHDPWSFCHLRTRRHSRDAFVFGDQPPTAADPLTPRAVDGLDEALYRSGLIHDDALMSELPSLDLAPYRLVIFATTVIVTDEQSALINTRVAVGGRHVAWIAWGGWSDGSRIGPDLAARCGGVTSHVIEPELPTSMLRLDGVVEEQTLPAKLPVVAYDLSETQTIGRWADGSSSAGRIDSNDAVIWLFAAAPTHAAFLRALGLRAKCHVVNDHEGDVNLLGAGLFVVHSLSGGRRHLHLPRGPRVSATLKPRSTTVFDASSGAVLLD